MHKTYVWFIVAVVAVTALWPSIPTWDEQMDRKEAEYATVCAALYANFDTQVRRVDIEGQSKTFFFCDVWRGDAWVRMPLF